MAPEGRGLAAYYTRSQRGSGSGSGCSLALPSVWLINSHHSWTHPGWLPSRAASKGHPRSASGNGRSQVSEPRETRAREPEGAQKASNVTQSKLLTHYESMFWCVCSRGRRSEGLRALLHASPDRAWPHQAQAQAQAPLPA